jgi:hypothetical protein
VSEEPKQPEEDAPEENEELSDATPGNDPIERTGTAEGDSVPNEASVEADATDETGTEAETGQAVPAGWYPDPQQPDSGRQRYWDGGTWTEKISAAGKMPLGAPAPAVSTERRSPDERKAILAQQIQFAAGRNRRIESQSDYQAVLVSGQPVNHTLHAILTIFTCLLWGVVWAIIAGTGGEKREMIVVDEFGNVQHTSLGKA